MKFYCELCSILCIVVILGECGIYFCSRSILPDLRRFLRVYNLVTSYMKNQSLSHFNFSSLRLRGPMEINFLIRVAVLFTISLLKSWQEQKDRAYFTFKFG